MPRPPGKKSDAENEPAALASELLGLAGEMVNYGNQLIGVIRKGGGLKGIPASPDVFVGLRLYQWACQMVCL